MSWLIEQLAIAEYEGDKVQIVAHIPGSDSEAYEGWAINYYNAVNRFEDTIVGQFFGHTHSEEFHLTYEDPEDHTSRPTSVIFSAPSATTYSNFNPAFRIYTIDGNYTGSTYQILDFAEWYFNLTEHGNANQTTWEVNYLSAKAEYGLNDMSPSEWNKLAERMRNDSNLMQTYLKNYFRRTDTARAFQPCDPGCTAGFVCSMRTAHHTNNLCKDLGINKNIPSVIKYKKEVIPIFPQIFTREEAIELVKKVIVDMKENGKNVDMFNF